MKTLLAIKLSAIVVVLGLARETAFAAAAASDTAANYVGTWSTTPANLGSGFGAWANQALNNNSPPYVGTYLDQTSYGNSGSVLSAGYSWGTYANGSPGNGEFILSRPFTVGTDGTANLNNQSFSIGIGSGGIGGAGSSLTLNIGSAFSLGYVGGGSDNMTLSVDGAAGSVVPVTFANLNAGLLVNLAVSGALNSTSEGYMLTITPFFGGAALYTASGTFDSSAYNTSSFSVADLNTSANAYVNNPTVTPEPSSLFLGLSGLLTLLVVRRRK
jgi:MYXO-CTERM domain-containing protein